MLVKQNEAKKQNTLFYLNATFQLAHKGIECSGVLTFGSENNMVETICILTFIKSRLHCSEKAQLLNYVPQISEGFKSSDVVMEQPLRWRDVFSPGEVDRKHVADAEPLHF